ncbi:glycosyltransferase family 39 protein [Streptomyces nogalater]
MPALVMLVLGLWRLDRGGMWRDEAVSFQVGRRTVPQIWHLLHDVDAVHGLYYLLLHAVLAVHPGEVVLRLPSVCAAAGTAALVAALGSRLVRPRAGLWAGLLYAVTPMAGHYAQEGRSYALVAAGATAATLLFVRAVPSGSWWPYGVVLALTCWLHEFAVLLLLAHAVSLALARAGGGCGGAGGARRRRSSSRCCRWCWCRGASRRSWRGCGRPRRRRPGAAAEVPGTGRLGVLGVCRARLPGAAATGRTAGELTCAGWRCRWRWCRRWC